MPVILTETLPRNANACECPACGGYARKVEATDTEVKEHQLCGRPWACCIGAFVCKRCELRIISQIAAPEWD